MKSQYQIDSAEVVELLRKQGRMMTYVVRNWLADGRPGLKTYQVRRVLERLEQQGMVERATDHPYVRQIGWRLPEAPQSKYELLDDFEEGRDVRGLPV